MTKANIKRAKQAVKEQIEKMFYDGNHHYGSSCSDLDATVHTCSIKLHYGKNGFGRCVRVVSGFTCNGTNPFIDYNVQHFTYTVDPGNGDVHVIDTWTKFN